LKAILPEARAFASIIEALSRVVDEASMKFTPEKVILRALDPAKVSMFIMELPSILFEEYDVEEEVKIGFNTAVLLKLLKRSKRDDKLEIALEEGYAKFSIIGAYSKLYKILNIETAEEELPEPRIELNVNAIIHSEPLKHAIKDAETIGDVVEFSAETEDELIIKGKGETSETETRISKESGALISLEVKEPSKSTYAIEHIKNIVSLTKVADTVEVSFSTRMPLKLAFTILGEGKVTYFLAPKVE